MSNRPSEYSCASCCKPPCGDTVSPIVRSREARARSRLCGFSQSVEGEIVWYQTQVTTIHTFTICGGEEEPTPVSATRTTTYIPPVLAWAHGATPPDCTASVTYSDETLWGKFWGTIEQDPEDPCYTYRHFDPGVSVEDAYSTPINLASLITEAAGAAVFGGAYMESGQQSISAQSIIYEDFGPPYAEVTAVKYYFWIPPIFCPATSGGSGNIKFRTARVRYDFGDDPGDGIDYTVIGGETTTLVFSEDTGFPGGSSTPELTIVAPRDKFEFGAIFDAWRALIAGEPQPPPFCLYPCGYDEDWEIHSGYGGGVE